MVEIFVVLVVLFVGFATAKYRRSVAVQKSIKRIRAAGKESQ